MGKYNQVRPDLRSPGNVTWYPDVSLASRETSTQVVKLRLVVVQIILALFECIYAANAFHKSPNETAIGLIRRLSSLVTAGFPPHAASQALLLDEIHFHLGGGDGVVRDHGAGACIVGPRGTCLLVKDLRCSGLGESFVVPNTMLPAPSSIARVGGAGPVGAQEVTAVQRHSQNDLGRRDSSDLSVVIDGLDRRKRGGRGVAIGWEEVGLVAGNGVPASGVIVCHEIVKVEKRCHLSQLKLGVIVWS